MGYYSNYSYVSPFCGTRDEVILIIINYAYDSTSELINIS